MFKTSIFSYFFLNEKGLLKIPGSPEIPGQVGTLFLSGAAGPILFFNATDLGHDFAILGACADLTFLRGLLTPLQTQKFFF